MSTKSRARMDATVGTDDLIRRQAAVREGVASASIEGGSVGADAKAIMGDWARGLITEDQAIALIKALHTKPQAGQTSAA